MTIEMRLQEKYYNFIKSGTKRIETRLFDEKRRSIQIGDEIVFIDRANENDTVRAKVTELIMSNSFAELVAGYDIGLFADKSITKEEYISDLDGFYPMEEQAKYGVVGIRFELL